MSPTLLEFAVAIILLQLTDGGRGGAVIGASLVVVLLGFALPRFLIDLVSGTFMFFEGWFDVGDTIHISPWDLTGVVEETSLRSTTLRSVRVSASRGRVSPRGGSSRCSPAAPISSSTSAPWVTTVPRPSRRKLLTPREV